MALSKKSVSNLRRIVKRRRIAMQRFEARKDLEPLRDFLADWLVKPVGLKTRLFGKPFVGAFPEQELSRGNHRFRIGVLDTGGESLVGVFITKLSEQQQGTQIGVAKISFDKEIVSIEAVQGRRGFVQDLKRFENATGVPWASFLVKKMIAVARRTGYRQIRLVKPTELFAYKYPTSDESHEKVRARIKKLYETIKDALAFEETKGPYWVKTL